MKWNKPELKIDTFESEMITVSGVTETVVIKDGVPSVSEGAESVDIKGSEGSFPESWEVMF